jgi:hypothetical protein
MDRNRLDARRQAVDAVVWLAVFAAAMTIYLMMQ